MRVLVTGSAGFLGRSLGAELDRRGHQWQGYDLDNGDDILDARGLRAALDGYEACIHLAAVADLYEAEAAPSRCMQINVEGTRVVALACREADARLLYASTCCVYGNNGLAVSDEQAPPAPTELYARTKLDGERFVARAGPRSSILRLATFYGPNMRASLATSLFLRRALAREAIEIHGDGRQTRCYTHVDDIASGIATVLEHPTPPPLVNIASEVPTSVLELAELVRQLIGIAAPLRFVDDRPGQIVRSHIDASRLRALGWAPRWTLREGLAQCLAALIHPGAGAAQAHALEPRGEPPP